MKIFPSGTKYISHLDVTTGRDFVGQASDSCWLFKVIEGKINAYTEMAELFAADTKAAELFADKKYNRAIKRYNRSSGDK